MLALAEGAGDGLAVPVGQRDRKAELSLAVAADDRLLTVRLPSRDTLLWVVLVWDSFSPTLTVAVLEMSSTTAASAETFTSQAERARGARSLLAERPGKGARRGVVAAPSAEPST